MPAPLSPKKLQWLPADQKYVFPTGHPLAGNALTDKAVRDVIDADIAHHEQAISDGFDHIREVARKMLAGEISGDEYRQAVLEWRDNTMVPHIRALHLNYTAAAHGGYAQLGPADYGRCGAKLKDQYRFLGGFVGDLLSDPNIALGQAPGKMAGDQRAALYATTALFTYEAERTESHIAQGFSRYRNVPHSQESCTHKADKPGCTEISSMGWGKIGSYAPIGTRSCGPADKCSWAFKK